MSQVGDIGTTIKATITDQDGTITGCVGRLTVEVDGRTVTVEGAGDVERPDIIGNNGTRLKHAESDAIGRAATKLGLGLHLWSQDRYRLDRALDRNEADDE